MVHSSSKLILPILLGIAVHTEAQCVTADYVPCLAPGAVYAAPPPSLSPPSFGSSSGSSSSFYSSDGPVQIAAQDGIQVGKARRDTVRDASTTEDSAELYRRQGSLCCKPSPVECLYADNVPFCYTPSTTRVFFSDGSYGYLSNNTFYGTDGSVVDYNSGTYTYPNGTVENFTPSSDSSSSSSSSSGSSAVSTTTSSAGATVASSSASPTSSSAGTNPASSPHTSGVVSFFLSLCSLLLL